MRFWIWWTTQWDRYLLDDKLPQRIPEWLQQTWHDLLLNDQRQVTPHVCIHPAFKACLDRQKFYGIGPREAMELEACFTDGEKAREPGLRGLLIPQGLLDEFTILPGFITNAEGDARGLWMPPAPERGI